MILYTIFKDLQTELAATGGGGIRINPSRVRIGIMETSEFEKIFFKITEEQNKIAFFFDMMALEYMKIPENDRHNAEAIRPVIGRFMDAAMMYAADNISRTNECAMSVCIFFQGYMAGHNKASELYKQTPGQTRKDAVGYLA